MKASTCTGHCSLLVKMFHIKVIEQDKLFPHLNIKTFQLLEFNTNYRLTFVLF